MSGLVLASLRYFWRTHLGVVLGATCSTAVLVGALAVGDSVRLTLRDQALHRVGRVEAAVVAGDRYFGADLADRVAKSLDHAKVAPVLKLQGIARKPQGTSRAGIVDVFGVDQRFSGLSRTGTQREPPRPPRTLDGIKQLPQAFVNERLAAQLGIGVGDEIIVRVEKPSLLPRDMLMSTIEDISFSMRPVVSAVLSEEEFGHFGLRASQLPPFNVFVSLAWLQEELGLPGRANVLLAGDTDQQDVVERANDALRAQWTLADAQLRVRNAGAIDELTSERVFIDRQIVEAIQRVETGALGVLTYFVNTLRHESRETPYSMVTAIGPLSVDDAPTHPMLVDTLGILPDGTGDDGIVLNEWCARDLRATVGDTIELDYFIMGPQQELKSDAHGFRLRAIVPIEGPAADRGLMPEFPGLADVKDCRKWEPGIPIDTGRIRDADQKYWKDHGGTPKGFVSLRAGRALWGNRFGSVTAVRAREGLAQRLRLQLPRDLAKRMGLFFQDVRGPALAAGTSATDFGGLFLGLSFFLIAAALLLTSLLFVFGVEQRANEIGVLLAVGFRPARVRRLFLGEALVLALIGTIPGAALGIGYTHAVLFGLDTLWRDAVGTTTLVFHAKPLTVVGGALIAVLVAVGAIALALRKTFDRPAVELLTSRTGISSAPLPGEGERGRVSLALAIGSPSLALALVLTAGGGSAQVAAAFFGAGALLLIGGLASCRRLLARFARAGGSVIGSVAALGMRNTGRRPGRSLATIALLASGTFLVVAVQANRLGPPRDASIAASGTGGFALFGRSTLPVLRDLETEAGRDAFGLSEDDLEGVSIVPMRVREGDDASCLNLSLTQTPQLLGVRPEALADRGAFRFVASLTPPDEATPKNPWSLLNADYGDGVVPAIGDQASVTWALHKSLGDDLLYRDDRGAEFRVRIVGTLANSILQGNFVIAERRMKARFPSASGHRMFLINAPPGERTEIVSKRLTDALEDIGLELTSTGERLASFNAVQNTYLLIFQALGGLGLLLGSVGVGMVVLRNTLERRSELALLSAVGFPARSVRRLVWSEHGLLLGLGLVCGVAAAILAVIPGLLGAGESLSPMPMVLLVAAVALSGAVWVFLASAAATRGPLLNALRSE